MTRKSAPPASPFVTRSRYEHLRSLRSQLNHCRLADPNRPEDIRELLTLLSRAGLLQKQIARHLKTGQATVSRWASGRQLPQSPYQRDLLVEALRTMLAAHIDAVAEAADPIRPATPRFRRRKPSSDPL